MAPEEPFRPQHFPWDQDDGMVLRVSEMNKKIGNVHPRHAERSPVKRKSQGTSISDNEYSEPTSPIIYLNTLKYSVVIFLSSAISSVKSYTGE